MVPEDDAKRLGSFMAGADEAHGELRAFSILVSGRRTGRYARLPGASSRNAATSEEHE
jgi:hypothetical protein